MNLQACYSQEQPISLLQSYAPFCFRFEKPTNTNERSDNFWYQADELCVKFSCEDGTSWANMISGSYLNLPRKEMNQQLRRAAWQHLTDLFQPLVV